METRIAYKLIELRQKNGFTQEVLAQKLDADIEIISSWEQANSIPDNNMLRRLSELYGVSFDEILTPPENIIQTEQIPIEETVLPAEEAVQERKGAFKSFVAAYPVFVLIFFLLAGFLFNLWDTAWLMFLTIPIVSVLYKASGEGQYDASKTLSRLLKFYYPGIVATVYLNIGVIFHLWHPTWILFLTIPLFYIFKAQNKSNG